MMIFIGIFAFITSCGIILFAPVHEAIKEKVMYALCATALLSTIAYGIYFPHELKTSDEQMQEILELSKYGRY